MVVLKKLCIPKQVGGIIIFWLAKIEYSEPHVSSNKEVHLLKGKSHRELFYTSYSQNKGSGTTIPKCRKEICIFRMGNNFPHSLSNFSGKSQLVSVHPPPLDPRQARVYDLPFNITANRDGYCKSTTVQGLYLYSFSIVIFQFVKLQMMCWTCWPALFSIAYKISQVNTFPRGVHFSKNLS